SLRGVLLLIFVSAAGWARAEDVTCQIPINDSCPPANTPPSAVDRNGDGTNDWKLGEFRDDCGNVIETWCMSGNPPYYLPLLNGVAIGKCPWWGGCNEGRKLLRRLPDGRLCIHETAWASLDQQYGDSDDKPETPGVDWYVFHFRAPDKMYTYCMTSLDGPGGDDPDVLVERLCDRPVPGGTFASARTFESYEALAAAARADPEAGGMARIESLIDLSEIGQAAGGSLSLTVSHRMLRVETIEGDGPGDLAERIAAAVNADEELAAHAIYAEPIRFVVRLTNVDSPALGLVSHDAGLRVPTLAAECALGDRGEVTVSWRARDAAAVTRNGVPIATDRAGSLVDPVPAPGLNTYVVSAPTLGLPLRAECAVDFDPVLPPCLGDVRRDQRLDALDIQRLINIILEVSPGAAAGDLNGDGQINVLDVQLAINKVLGLPGPQVDPAAFRRDARPLAADEAMLGAVRASPDVGALSENLAAMGAGFDVARGTSVRLSAEGAERLIASMPVTGPTDAFFASVVYAMDDDGNDWAVGIDLAEGGQLRVSDFADEAVLATVADDGIAPACERTYDDRTPRWQCMAECLNSVMLSGRCAAACGPDGGCQLCLADPIGLCVAHCAPRPAVRAPRLAVMRGPSNHAGEVHMVTLGGDLPAGVEAYGIERTCQGGDGFAPVARLDAEHRTAVLSAPVVWPTHPMTLFDESALAVLGRFDEYVALLTEVPIDICRRDRACAQQLDGIVTALGEAEAAGEAIAEELSGPALGPFIERPEVLACRYRGVGLGVGDQLEEGPGRNRVYADWEAVINDPADPCDGMTPLACYAARLRRWMQRVCGEVDAQGNAVNPAPAIEDLDPPFRRMCQAIRNGWVTFADPVCEPLEGGTANGVTTSEPPDDPPPDELPPGGEVSRVAFDTEFLARDVCSYG
ncbi:MAG: hypothetical protein KC620_21170, partial [Myxococcales bacterium]|nr:hypothetical protein [Myxococcales bacterium]